MLDAKIKCPISLIICSIQLFSIAEIVQKLSNSSTGKGLHRKKRHTLYRNDNHSKSGLNLVADWHFCMMVKGGMKSWGVVSLSCGRREVRQLFDEFFIVVNVLQLKPTLNSKALWKTEKEDRGRHCKHPSSPWRKVTAVQNARGLAAPLLTDF